MRPWVSFAVQFVPLATLCMIIAACSGGPGLGDFSARPTSNIFLRGFTEVGQLISNINSNTPTAFTPISDVKPRTQNQNATFCGQAFTFPDVSAVLAVSNGVSARLERIEVHFSEVDGSDLIDLTLSPPVRIGGQFDYFIGTSLSIEAPPITEIPGGQADPTGRITDHFIPLQLYMTSIFCNFQIFQPSRPLLARITLRGQDIFGHPFTLVGFLIMSSLVRT